MHPWIRHLVSGVCFIAAAVTGNGQVAPEKTGKIRVLIVTGGHGFEVEPFFKVFADNPQITFTAAKHSKNADVYDRADLKVYDVLVLYDMAKSITETQRKNFMSLVEKGTGFVVLHHALVSYPDWAEFEQFIGGKYSQADEKTGLAGYQHDVDIPVKVAAKDHPITQGIPDFVIHDEIYWGFRVKPDAIPLLTTTHPRSGNPLAWIQPNPKTRVVYFQLGHGPTAYEHPQYREMVARCIRWAARR